MTAIVGVLCKNGIVVGADSAATFAHPQINIIEQCVDKLCLIGNKIIVASTGEVGLNQRFCEIVKNSWDKKQFSNSNIEIGKMISRFALQDFQSTFVPKLNIGSLMAFVANGKPYLCEFDGKTF